MRRFSRRRGPGWEFWSTTWSAVRKESRITAGISGPNVLVLGHPYVDVWQAVKPATIGVARWPVVPRGADWKQGICDALGVSDPRIMWLRIIGAVTSYTDLEVPLLQAMEHLIDFVTADV